MESYRGLAILTSNMKNALDKAFLRRIRFVVQFPFPGMAQRAAIWRKVFPESTPKGNLDWEKLARLSLPGGNIRNIAMNAAFIAADEDQPVGMPHILRAARTEYTKLDKPMNGMEI
jgi:ATP-dependent 26S proteasome regulatory subunit